MSILIFLVTTGAAFGTASGLFAYGLDGGILGASAGIVVGTGAWVALATVEHIRRERRLDRHFEQGMMDR